MTIRVKNTFIDIDACVDLPSLQRSSSAPAFSQLCQGTSLEDESRNSADDVSTHASSESESGSRTPMTTDGDSTPCTPQSPKTFSMPPPPEPFAPALECGTCGPRRPAPAQRLNAKAAAFLPQSATRVQNPMHEQYKMYFAEVMCLATLALQSSKDVMSVEVAQDAAGWSVVIQPAGRCDEKKTEVLMTLAKEALLSASSKSKHIHVMGYSGPKPFDMCAQGFEATLGAMKSASTACWHIFKKGFCRHGDGCSKQHAVCQVPVRVLIEGVQLKAGRRAASSFTQAVGDLALGLTSALEESPYLERVTAFKDKDHPGWTIEMIAKGQLTAQNEEYLLTLAKKAFFSANLDNVYIMGAAAKPFMSKPHGFVSIIGNMKDESKVCWDLYSKGCCTRHANCRWAHPECLMPINVVVKEKSACFALPISLHAAMQQVSGSDWQILRRENQ